VLDHGGATSSVVFVDTATGAPAWITPSGVLSSFGYDPTTGLLVEYGQDRALLARDAKTGLVRWRVERGFGRVLAAGGVVWIAGEGRLASYDGMTGAPLTDVAIVVADATPVYVSGRTVVLAE
jgi:hypothetical protein